MNRQLYLAYLKEQYDAARHHQTMRIATLSFFVSTSGVVLAKIVDAKCNGIFLGILGLILILLGILSHALNGVFSRSNRQHVETASWTRLILAVVPEATTGPDPNVIRKSVRKHLEGTKTIADEEKREEVLDERILAELKEYFSQLPDKKTGKTKDGPEKPEQKEASRKIEYDLNDLLGAIPKFMKLAGTIVLTIAVLSLVHDGLHVPFRLPFLSPLCGGT
jgi:hypothetical protein